MKFKYLFILIIAFLGIGQLSAQKFGYVDTDYILGQLTEYKAAQKQLNEISQKWESEIQTMKDAIDKLYKDYKSEEILLSPSQRKEREDAIVEKENKLREFEQEKFGVNGELFKKRQELIKPIQSKISDAILKVAKKNGLDFIFDKSANMNILYSNPKFDRSDDVLDELGVTPTKD
ncbi:MAG: OmpH family outer membrane protein [Bacteroidota bacterium]|nr:OmpH family outer membrane protein [Bacteroidota bacterium]